MVSMRNKKKNIIKYSLLPRAVVVIALYAVTPTYDSWHTFMSRGICTVGCSTCSYTVCLYPSILLFSVNFAYKNFAVNYYLASKYFSRQWYWLVWVGGCYSFAALRTAHQECFKENRDFFFYEKCILSCLSAKKGRKKRGMIGEKKYQNNSHPHLLQTLVSLAFALLLAKLVGRPSTENYLAP